MCIKATSDTKRNNFYSDKSGTNSESASYNIFSDWAGTNSDTSNNYSNKNDTRATVEAMLHLSPFGVRTL